MALTEEHERIDAWEQLWFIQNGYMDALSKERRDDLEDFLYDALDAVRSEKQGGTLPTADTSEQKRPKQENDDFSDPVHDPTLYSFGAKKSWIPYAEDGKSGAKRGRYKNGYPTGLVVHWTAGHRNGLKQGVNLMRATGMLYLLIDAEGSTAQTDPLTHWGYHAGASKHSGASGTVSDEYAGVEIQAAGTLRKSGEHFYPWWDKGKNSASNRIDPAEVVKAPKKGNIAAGYYHVYTQDQMTALRILCCWLYLNNPTVFSISRIVGHDEVSPGRKTDPGGALIDKEGNPISMSEFRDWLERDIEIIKANFT